MSYSPNFVDTRAVALLFERCGMNWQGALEGVERSAEWLQPTTDGRVQMSSTCS